MKRKVLSFLMAMVVSTLLVAPTKMIASAETDSSGSTYVVQKGDFLEKIAQEQLGDSKRWKEIYELNKDKIKNPSIIRAGMELRLTAEEETADTEEKSEEVSAQEDNTKEEKVEEKQDDKEEAKEEKVEEKQDDKEEAKEEKVEEKQDDKEEAKEEKVEEKKDDKEEAKDEKVEEKKDDKEEAKDEKVEEKKDDKEEAKDEKVEEKKDDKEEAKDEKVEEKKDDKEEAKDEKVEEKKDDKEAKDEKVEEEESEEDAEAEETDEAEEKEEPELEYWAADSPVAAAIVEYVEDVTDENSEHFIPVEDRIAVSDMDGTLIGELYPSYFEYMMFINRALYDDTYEAPEDMKEFAKALEKGIYTGDMPEEFETKHAKYAGQSYAGMTPDELKEYTKKFMDTEADGFKNLKKGEAIYKPMVSMIEYLVENDFQVYIVSGSDRTVCRAIIKDNLPIPENRIIGMSYTMVAKGQGDTDGLEYVYSKDDEVILGGDLIIKTIKMNKVSEIAQEIGKVPVLSFGNSSGDISMAQYVTDNDKYESRAFMVLCDDLEREHGNMETADKMRKTCLERGFMPISMRDDFGTIYGDDVEVEPYDDYEELENAG
ncbi:LysM peptidoglycan-binding domain-containing protein [Butyrivibrio sp. AE3004]|uniref:LysM peptidoglycan-binding domain-containing protein n=1 Tax=Butyrivibrio sp. AE3004 TaxID=1506994 RepID=UPI00068F3406|nr:LysM peptidoglycan-binding domain-containing protein [Butyrivibrio sp. AE3004]